MKSISIVHTGYIVAADTTRSTVAFCGLMVMRLVISLSGLSSRHNSVYSQLPRHLGRAALDHLHHVVDRVPQGDQDPRAGGEAGAGGDQTPVPVPDTRNQYPIQRLRQENFPGSSRWKSLICR